MDEQLVRRVRAGLLRMRETRAYQLRLAEELGLRFPEFGRDRWRRDARYRLVSLKLDHARHPLPNDTLWRAAWCGVTTSLSRARNPTARWPDRVLQAGWFVVVAIAPQRIACSLIERYWFPRTRGPLVRSVFRRLQWMRRVAGPQGSQTAHRMADAGRAK